jgi:tRNA-dihydrouridine synthase B
VTLRIANICLDSPVLLAPMAGITDLPFRRLVKSFGAGLVVSEMIASKAMMHGSARTLRMCGHVPEEQPMAVQLAGCDAGDMAEAARLGESAGASIIDINMGCPAKKVTKGAAGAALMRDETLAARILTAVVEAVSVPVTLKMRTGWNEHDKNAPRLARIAESCGIKAVTVHGRTRCQFYQGEADWPFIGEVKRAVTIPVIGNGDVRCGEDAKRLLTESGADGVMVGRAAYGRPWLINKIDHYLRTGRHQPDPTLSQQMDVLLEHYESMLMYYGSEIGMRAARKHVGWYSKGLPGGAEFRARVMRLGDPGAVKMLIREFYLPIIDREAA